MEILHGIRRRRRRRLCLWPIYRIFYGPVITHNNQARFDNDCGHFFLMIR